MKIIKPYEKEEKGWFDSQEDEACRNYTFYDFIIAGIQKWEGVYENHSETSHYIFVHRISKPLYMGVIKMK